MKGSQTRKLVIVCVYSLDVCIAIWFERFLLNGFVCYLWIRSRVLPPCARANNGSCVFTSEGALPCCYLSDYKCTWDDSPQCVKCKMLQRLRVSLGGCSPRNAKDVGARAGLPRLAWRGQTGKGASRTDIFSSQQLSALLVLTVCW